MNESFKRVSSLPNISPAKSPDPKKMLQASPNLTREQTGDYGEQSMQFSCYKTPSAKKNQSSLFKFTAGAVLLSPEKFTSKANNDYPVTDVKSNSSVQLDVSKYYSS